VPVPLRQGARNDIHKERAAMESPDIVIVGGGIGGGALATVLARHGLTVAVLERDPHPVDRVRGEWMAPWGVTEAATLGILDILRTGAGGFHVPLVVNYDETSSPHDAWAAASDLSKAHAIGTGPLCAGHPAMCEALTASAAASGAAVLRGVKDVAVTAGEPPSIRFQHDGHTIFWRPRMIVGADGRNSTVRRQLGFTMLHDEPHNLIGGMLIDGVPEWPEDVWDLGTEGDIHQLVFPQGGGKLRLYVCYDFANRARFTGVGRERNLLAAFNLKCLPLGEQIARAEPIGPFHSYSNEDHWVERPIAPGVVLLGDAAGHNDPLIGQGLSITLRDVRILRDIILAGDWRMPAFEAYVEERSERMRRLRIAARFASSLRVRFGPEAAARRLRVMRRIHREKWLSPFGAPVAGPETLPAEAFDQATIDAVMADD
jgi:2-polyprenyl-6-methoxyphenol hydroxylase-like FAD-dependent oxidoreductase